MPGSVDGAGADASCAPIGGRGAASGDRLVALLRGQAVAADTGHGPEQGGGETVADGAILFDQPVAQLFGADHLAADARIVAGPRVDVITAFVTEHMCRDAHGQERLAVGCIDPVVTDLELQALAGPIPERGDMVGPVMRA